MLDVHAGEANGKGVGEPMRCQHSVQTVKEKFPFKGNHCNVLRWEEHRLWNLTDLNWALDTPL